MNRLRNILVATDFSPAAGAAAQQAARLAQANNAALHVLHVVPRQHATEIATLIPDDPALAMEHIRDDAMNRLRAEFSELGVKPTQLHVSSGTTIREILAAVKRLDVDLLAVGVNGASRAHGVGTIAIRCARKAPTRVLLVPERANDRFNRIVACVDFSRLTHGVLEQSFRVARLDGAPVTALHVYEAPWERMQRGRSEARNPELEDQIRSVLSARMQERIDLQGVEPEGIDIDQVVLKCDDHGEGIVRCARESNADLIVLGTTGRSALAYMLLGTTAEKVLRDVGCTVLTVKLPGTASNAVGELESAFV